MRNLVRTSLVSTILVGVFALAASAVQADPITFTTSGTFWSADPTVDTTSPNPAFSRAMFGGVAWIKFWNGSGTFTPTPGGSSVSLGLLQMAIAGNGGGPHTGTFTLNINQTGANPGSGSLVSTFTIFPNPGGGGGVVTFSPASIHIGGILYSLSSNGSFQLSVLNDGASYGPAVTVGAQATPNPEPASLLLLGTGLVGAAAGLRRRRRNKKALEQV